MRVKTRDVAARLGRIEVELRALRRSLVAAEEVLDALATLPAGEDGKPKTMKLTGGYVPISRELGLFIGQGSVEASLVKTDTESALTLFGRPDRPAPKEVIVQVNLPYALVRGRAALGVEADVQGRLDRAPRCELRFFGEAGMLRQITFPCDAVFRDGKTYVNLSPDLPKALMRSEALTEIQVCLMFSEEVLGKAITHLSIV